MKLAAATLLGLLCACSQTFDPCPPGSDPLRGEDRCVVWQRDDAGVDEPGTDGGFDAGELLDASDGQVGDLDGSMGDAGDGDAEAGSEDAGHDAGDAEVLAPVCSQGDLAAWTEFHATPGLVDTLLDCGPLGCTPEACPAAACIRESAGVAACEECTAAEGDCVLEHCRSPCGTPGSDPECRACLCEAGCVARFEGCTRTSLDLCEGVYGRDATAEELAFTRPLVYRKKSGTGVVTSGPLLAYPSETNSEVLKGGAAQGLFRQAGSPGFTHLVSLTLDGRPYLLEHKSSCGDYICIARISPALGDGSFGRAEYVDTWSRGWDEIEPFQAGGHTYLLRYKTGRAVPDGEPKGTLRIDRLRRDAASSTITLENVLEELGVPLQEQHWSSIEPFAHAGATHLLFYATDSDGAVQLRRVSASATRFTLEPAASSLDWTRGWDVVETVPLGGRAYVLLYKSGRVATSDEPQGTVRVLGFSGAANQPVGFSTVLFEGTWPTGFTHVIGYADGSHSYLLRVNAISGAAALIRLNEAAQLASLGATLTLPTWAANPPYDLIEVVRQQPW
jgi:hypothetical protein